MVLKTEMANWAVDEIIESSWSTELQEVTLLTGDDVVEVMASVVDDVVMALVEVVVVMDEVTEELLVVEVDVELEDDGAIAA